MFFCRTRSADLPTNRCRIQPTNQCPIPPRLFLRSQPTTQCPIPPRLFLLRRIFPQTLLIATPQHPWILSVRTYWPKNLGFQFIHNPPPVTVYPKFLFSRPDAPQPNLRARKLTCPSCAMPSTRPALMMSWAQTAPIRSLLPPTTLSRCLVLPY